MQQGPAGDWVFLFDAVLVGLEEASEDGRVVIRHRGVVFHHQADRQHAAGRDIARLLQPSQKQPGDFSTVFRQRVLTAQQMYRQRRVGVFVLPSCFRRIPIGLEQRLAYFDGELCVSSRQA